MLSETARREFVLRIRAVLNPDHAHEEDGSREFFERVFGNDAEEFADFFRGNRVAAIRAGLLEQRKRVAHAAFGHAGDYRESSRFDLEIFFRCDFFESRGDLGESERAKVEMLRARTNRIDEIFGLGRRHHEDDAIGRLFERLEQGVGGFAGEHVRFVEDDDFVARSRWRVADHFAKFANLVDAAVGGGVDFDDVERRSEGDLLTGVALAAGIGGRPIHTVQSLGEDAGGGGLADSACSRKNVSVRDAIVADGVR